MPDVNQRLQRIVDLHFDPNHGAPYWIEQRELLSFDPRSDIRSAKDLRAFGPFPMAELASRPVEDFVPRRFHDSLHSFVTSESGGTTGRPSRTVFREDEFRAAFVTPFVEAAARMNFPRGEHWLFIGPSGPHVIAKGARACAAAVGSMDLFAVDFDPRWARKLPADSFARGRYMAHILDQALDVLESQRIGVLFSTPPVLAALGEKLDATRRARIRGVHLGGVAGAPHFWRELTRTWFPNAVALSGYGNSMLGVCPQLQFDPDMPPEYFVHGDRLIVEIEGGTKRGPLCFHRLDESVFLPQVIERDEAELLDRAELVDGSGFQRLAIREPRPPERSPLADALY